MSPMRSGRNDHRRGRDGLRDNGPTHQPAHQAPAGPLTDRCPDDAERSYADHALSRAAREITLPTRSPQRLLREKTRPTRVTQPHSRYKTRPAHPFSPHARYKTRPARPKRPNLACFARAWRTFYRFRRQQAVQGELSTVFATNKPSRANFVPNTSWMRGQHTQQHTRPHRHEGLQREQRVTAVTTPGKVARNLIAPTLNRSPETLKFQRRGFTV